MPARKVRQCHRAQFRLLPENGTAPSVLVQGLQLPLLALAQKEAEKRVGVRMQFATPLKVEAEGAGHLPQ